MTGKIKRNMIILLTVVFILVFFISAGLTNLKLNAGMPLPEINSGKGTVTLESHRIELTVPLSDLLKKIFIIIFTVVIASLVIRMIIKIEFKNILCTIINVLIITIGVMGIFLLIIFFFPPSENTGISEIVIKPPKEIYKTPLGSAPFILILIMCFIVLIGIILIVYKIFFHADRTEGESHKIVLEALRTRDAILNGADLKNAITECYIRMCEVLKQENEIEREKSMTPEEFEKRLEEAGAPKIYIGKLTVLFEAVRYGNLEPTKYDEQKAIKCFDAIILHFRNESEKKNHGKK